MADCSMLKEKVCENFDDWHTFFNCISPYLALGRSAIPQEAV